MHPAAYLLVVLQLGSALADETLRSPRPLGLDGYTYWTDKSDAAETKVHVQVQNDDGSTPRLAMMGCNRTDMTVYDFDHAVDLRRERITIEGLLALVWPGPCRYRLQRNSFWDLQQVTFVGSLVVQYPLLTDAIDRIHALLDPAPPARPDIFLVDPHLLAYLPMDTVDDLEDRMVEAWKIMDDTGPLVWALSNVGARGKVRGMGIRLSWPVDGLTNITFKYFRLRKRTEVQEDMLDMVSEGLYWLADRVWW